MTIKVGINGFGRIGRMVFRAIDKDFDNLEVVGINDLLDNDYLSYMLKYDSVHGRFGKDVEVEGNNFVIDGKKIRLTAERNPADLKWGDIGADLGVFATPGTFLVNKRGEILSEHLGEMTQKIWDERFAKLIPKLILSLIHI